MALHPILNEKLNAAVLADLDLQTTRRDAVLPAVPGKVQAVIGMRRAGKTTFLRQLQGDWRTSAPAERVVYLSFDDDRLSDLPVEQLGLALEEYYRELSTPVEGDSDETSFDETSFDETDSGETGFPPPGDEGQV